MTTTSCAVPVATHRVEPHSERWIRPSWWRTSPFPGVAIGKDGQFEGMCSATGWIYKFAVLQTNEARDAFTDIARRYNRVLR